MARGGPSEAIDQTSVSGQDVLPRKITPEMRTTDYLAAPLTHLASAFDEKFQRDSQIYAGAQASQFGIEASQLLEQHKQQRQDGDPQGFTPGYLVDYDNLAKKYLTASANNPRAQQLLREHFNTLRGHFGQEAVGFEAQQTSAFDSDRIGKARDNAAAFARANPGQAVTAGVPVMSMIGAARLTPAQRLIEARATDNMITHGAALGMVDSNPGEVYRQLKAGSTDDPVLSRLIDPNLRSDVMAKATNGMVDQIASGVVDSFRQGGPVTGATAYSSIDKMDLTPELKDSVRNTVQKKRGELHAEQDSKYGQTIMGLEDRIGSGNPAAGDESLVRHLWYDNGITAERAGTMLAALHRAHDTQDQAAINEAWVQKVLASEGPGKVPIRIDPKDTNAIKAVDDYFDKRRDFWAKSDAPGASQSWENEGVQFARSHGIIPKGYSSFARAQLTGSTDMNQVGVAADIVKRMRDAAPGAWQYFDDDKRLSSMADTINELRSNGVPLEQAVTTARENANLTEGEHQRLLERWPEDRKLAWGSRGFGLDQAMDAIHLQSLQKIEEARKAGTNPADLPKEDKPFESNHWYTPNPTPPPEMAGDFERLTKAYYLQNRGDIKTAQERALNDLRHVWGVSYVNGKPELMPYPPEMRFRAPDGGPGLTVEDIRTDIAAAVTQHGAKFTTYDPVSHALIEHTVDPKDVQVIPTRDSRNSNGVKGWQLGVLGPDGRPDILHGKDGKPLSYDMPVSEEAWKALQLEHAKQRKQLEDEAEARRVERSGEARAFQRDMDSYRQNMGGFTPRH